MKVDWSVLAREMGTLINSQSEMGGSDLGTQAIEHVLGAEFFEQAVEHYVSGEEGSELARSVLLRLRPWSGMKHCYVIFKTSQNSYERVMAVELLPYVGDGRVLKWIPEFLADSDRTIQNLSMRIIEQLLYRHLIDDEDVEEILEAALTHENEVVREQAALYLVTDEDESAED
jgi:HEAT repeat protein